MSEQNLGLKFEEELAKEFGLDRVPGSGSIWHSKLDLSGNNARWSLKATSKDRWPISMSDIMEGIDMCFGPGGDGSTPMWAARTPIGDFILMRKEDWISFHVDDLKLINKKSGKAEEREARSKVPALLREE